MRVALSNLGAIVTLALGVLGLFAPTRASSFANVQPVGLIGRSEIRATYGGLFVALGAACLLTQAPGVFLAAGLAWVGAAIGRSFSVFIDSSRSARNLGGIVFELAIGLSLLSQHLAAT